LCSVIDPSVLFNLSMRSLKLVLASFFASSSSLSIFLRMCRLCVSVKDNTGACSAEWSVAIAVRAAEEGTAVRFLLLLLDDPLSFSFPPTTMGLLDFETCDMVLDLRRTKREGTRWRPNELATGQLRCTLQTFASWCGDDEVYDARDSVRCLFFFFQPNWHLPAFLRSFGWRGSVVLSKVQGFGKGICTSEICASIMFCIDQKRINIVRPFWQLRSRSTSDLRREAAAEARVPSFEPVAQSPLSRINWCSFWKDRVPHAGLPWILQWE
jgi:hypothetical protein